MSMNLKPPAKCSMRDPAIRRRAAARIRSLRNALQLTREECAQLIGCGVRNLAAWESGETKAPVDALEALEALASGRRVA